MVIQAQFIFEVTAEVNNHGRETLLITNNQFKALNLAKEINAGKYAGAMQAAIIKTTIL